MTAREVTVVWCAAACDGVAFALLDSAPWLGVVLFLIAAALILAA